MRECQTIVWRMLCALAVICTWQSAATAQSIIGADPTGVSDSSAAFNAATANMRNVTVLTIPPGRYKLDKPWVIADNGIYVEHNVRISGYGVEFIPRSDAPDSPAAEDRKGDMSAIKIRYNSTPYQLTIEGITVNHLGNGVARSAFEVTGSSHVHLVDTTVIAHSTGSNYAAYWLHNSNPAIPDTGSFWTVIERCAVRKRSGNEGQRITTGIRLQGAANATTIQNCSIASTLTAIEMISESSGIAYLPNGVLIHGNWIEGFDAYAILVVAAQGRTASGLRIVNNRVENTNVPDSMFFRYAGAGGNEADPPFLAYNHVIGVPLLIENDAQRKILLYDAHEMTRENNPNLNTVRTDRFIYGR